jgi:hypothetical protein
MTTISPTDPTTSRFENLVSQFRLKAFIQRDFSAIDQHLTADFVDHFAPPWDPPGTEGVRRRFTQAAQAFLTTQVEVLHSLSKDDILMQAIQIHLRHTGDFMGIPATNRDLVIGGFDAFQIRGNQLAAHWGVYDVSRIPDLLGLTPGLPADGNSPSWATMWER